MSGQMIEFKGNGSTYQGYLARSASGKGPGVIVLQEWWGLVGHIKDVADRFASAGFTALAPDLYEGDSTSEPDEAGSLMMALNIGTTEKILHGAIEALLADPATQGPKVGVVGFCMGGQLSLFAASINPKIGACVDFYGIHPNVHPEVSKLNGPFLGIFAENDAYANAEAVANLERALKMEGKAFETITYPGTQHAFFNDARPEVYDAAASADAWKRMLEFFMKNLE